jgi:hypothetical protein
VVKGGQFLVTPQVTINRSAVVDPNKNRKQLLRELAQTLTEIRREAKEKGLSRMPAREIHAAVSAARRDPKAKKTNKQPAR